MQFFRGIFAQGPDINEQNMINDLLPPKAQQAFYSMTLADQRHSLNVLESALQLVQDESQYDSIALLKRCCLLHDIGRGPHMGSFKKALAVLMDKFFHGWAQKQGQVAGGEFYKDILYRYYNHPQISSEMLQAMGMEQEANIVLRHHNGDTSTLSDLEITVLRLLMQADEIN